MPYTNVNQVKRRYQRVVLSQLSLGLLAFCIISIIYHNLDASLAAALGIIMALVPTLVYIWVVHKTTIAAPVRLYAIHKKAMLCKFVVSILMFACLLVTFHTSYLLAIFVTYIITLTGSWFALLIK